MHAWNFQLMIDPPYLDSSEKKSLHEMKNKKC